MVARNLLALALCLTTVLMQLNYTVATPPSGPTFLKNLHGLDPRIINGTPALLDNTKHQVSLRDRADDSVKFGAGHQCGGSLISENVVLCAAHCFFNAMANDGSLLPIKDFIIVMGNLNRFDENNNTLVFDIKKRISYNAVFNINTFDDDIVLLVLNGTVPANHPTIQPIALNAGSLKEGTECQVTGWGVNENGSIPNILLTTDVPIISIDNCRSKTIYGDKIHEGMLCAGHSKGERDACQGDSGGPLVCGGVQVGIVSWGIECAKPDQPGIYTDVAVYKHWILSKVTEYGIAEPQFMIYTDTEVGGNNITNSTTGEGGGDGSMSTYNGSVILVAFMAVFGAIFSRF